MQSPFCQTALPHNAGFDNLEGTASLLLHILVPNVLVVAPY